MKKTTYVVLGISAFIFIGAVLILMSGGLQVIMGRIMGPGSASESLNTASSRLSEEGVFNVAYNSSVEPVPLNKIHTWTIHVDTADGSPLEQAEITVSGGMPEHGHGLPTKPQVTQNLGGGDYLVEGLRFNMPGWWEVTFQITANDQSDSVTFNLVLK